MKNEMNKKFLNHDSRQVEKEGFAANAYKFEISNGTSAELFYNNYYDQWQLDHFSGDRIVRIGMFSDEEVMCKVPQRRLAKLAYSWGGFTVKAPVAAV